MMVDTRYIDNGIYVTQTDKYVEGYPDFEFTRGHLEQEHVGHISYNKSESGYTLYTEGVFMGLTVAELVVIMEFMYMFPGLNQNKRNYQQVKDIFMLLRRDCKKEGE